jgi:hypothetical protein
MGSITSCWLLVAGGAAASKFLIFSSAEIEAVGPIGKELAMPCGSGVCVRRGAPRRAKPQVKKT